MNPKVSVIIPCYNEAAHVDTLVANLLEQDYPRHRMEILFADGQSTDATRDKLTAYCARHPFMKVLDNPDKYVPQGLNACIREARGEVIIRMDAHSYYPSNYISVLTERLFSLNAENVGGVWITEPGSDTAEAKAIALATSHPVGIGNAGYRLGADEEKPVDTVPYGCFRRDLFDRIGYFDEDLIRNQDDEFNGRIIRNGGKIWLIPTVHIRYFARPSREKLSHMFYQYGYFKPLVNRKLGAPATLRQFAPPILVLSAMIALVLPFADTRLSMIPVLWVLAYFGGVLIISASIAAREGTKYFLHLFLTFPTIHFSYGFGYLAGWLKWNLFKSTSTTIKDNR